VVGVGNAGGEGGRPSAAPGQVTGLDQSITATDENGSDPEWLTGLIATDADIRPGDSGGPLLDGADKVVGMDTAGSSGGGDGYAIPIADALAAAHDIESGGAGSQPGSGSSQGGSSQGGSSQGGSSQGGSGQGGSGQGGSGQGGSGQGGSGQGGTTQSGGAYLGVEVQDGPYGPQITGVVAGTPADRAGLTAGDTIVSVAGQRIGGVGDLAAVMASLAPGQRVDVTYVGTDGASQSAAVTLAAAPTA
jgi:S1-C subfamily serine protease